MSYQEWKFSLSKIVDPMLKSVGLRAGTEVTFIVEKIVCTSPGLEGKVLWTVANVLFVGEELTERVQWYSKDVARRPLICVSDNQVTLVRSDLHVCRKCGRTFVVPDLYPVLWDSISGSLGDLGKNRKEAK